MLKHLRSYARAIPPYVIPIFQPRNSLKYKAKKHSLLIFLIRYFLALVTEERNAMMERLIQLIDNPPIKRY